MSDYFLRATNEAEMNADLLAAAIIDSEGIVYPGFDLSVIGVINKDGEEIPGWHANLRASVELMDSQIAELPIIQPPEHPVRVWFDTVRSIGIVETVPTPMHQGEELGTQEIA